MAICSGENAAYARTLGAADVVDYTTGDVVETIHSRFEDGLDAIADLHGDPAQVSRLAEQVRDGGHVVSAVGAADPERLGSGRIQTENISGNVSTAALETLIAMVERDEIITPPIHPFLLGDAGRALELVGSQHVRGKVVVEIAGPRDGGGSAPTRGGSNVPNAGRDADEGRTE